MKKLLTLCAVVLFLSACTEMELASHLTKQAIPPSKSQGTFKVGTPYKVEGKHYYPEERYDLVETGIASWYGKDFQGKRTANGETYDMNELTAAHKTLQMPSLVRVTNLENGRSLIVRVNDRGPYKKGRVMDVSMKAAELLGFKSAGTAKVKLEVLKQESLKVAQAAKNGLNTSGYETALNRGGTLPDAPASFQLASAQASPYPGQGGGITPPGSVQSEPLSSGPQPLAGHLRDGEFYPDAVVTERSVTASDIFVQAGSFTVSDNAYRMSAALQQFAKTDVYPAMVGGRQFYRVRLGPIASVEQADALLERLVSSGNNGALIVVE